MEQSSHTVHTEQNPAEMEGGWDVGLEAPQPWSVPPWELSPGTAGAVSSPMSLLMVKQNSLKHEKGGPKTTETAFKSLLLAWEQH